MTAGARYARQHTAATLDADAQDRLARARVAVVGAGGLGCPVLTYLACAGVGHLRVLDGDVVEESNLNRQFLHATTHLGVPKAENAARVLRDLNPLVDVVAVTRRVEPDDVDELLAGVDVVVDASDNHATRTQVGSWAQDHHVDVVWGVVYGMSGYAGSVVAGRGHPYHRLFPDPADAATVELPTQAGVLGAACGVIGSVMAMEVIRRAGGAPPRPVSRLTYYDGGTGRIGLLEPTPLT